MDAKVNETEVIKARSNFLRGTLAQSMANDFTGALAPDDAQLSKFHGFYQQDDRDRRQDRRLEPYYSFTLRARLPGGVCTPAQWLVMDEIGRQLGNGTLRLTSRQTFQLHGILKRKLKGVIEGINRALIDSICGCGDVRRNVVGNPNPVQSALHAETHAWARRISEHLLPRTRAYPELWLDGERVAAGEESEPVYGASHLPRKFKTAVAVPPPQ
jgi:sulfite reductase (NADPH) hemoprotein beta-component